jgi:hypothetical protein
MEAIASDVFETRAQRKVPAWVAGLARTGWAVWKFVAGTLLAMHPAGALIVAGWTNRFMQRTAFKAWWKQTERPFKKLMTFREAAAHTPGWIDHASWPNWVLSQTPVADLRRGRVHRLVLGLWNNLRIGFLAVFNTALVLLLPSLLMAVWWYAGWQVSFNKAYEYFANGALFSLTGGLLLIAVMFYVPMAQARQAVAGEARRFWQFGLVRRIIRRRWLLCTLLALGYSAAGAVVMILISIPMSPGLQDYFNSLPADRLKLYLHAYYLSAALFIFPAYVVLRWFAARIYASAIGHMLSTGEVRADELAPSERLAFPPELINSPAAAAEWTRRDAIVSWTLSAPFRTTCAVIVFAAWAVFVAEVYISQFFIYRGPRVWLNHPLIQLPWADYTPPAPQEPR